MPDIYTKSLFHQRRIPQLTYEISIKTPLDRQRPSPRPHPTPPHPSPLVPGLIKVPDPRRNLLHLRLHRGPHRLVHRVPHQQIIAVPGPLDQDDGGLVVPLEGAPRPEDRGHTRGPPGVVLPVGGEDARRVGVEPAARLRVERLGRVAQGAVVGELALAREPQLALALVVARVDEAREDGGDSLGGATATWVFTWSALDFVRTENKMEVLSSRRMIDGIDGME